MMSVIMRSATMPKRSSASSGGLIQERMTNTTSPRSAKAGSRVSMAIMS